MFGLKDRSSIAIGSAEIRIGEYESNVNQLLPVLTEANYFGYSEVVNVVYSVDTKTRNDVASLYTSSAHSNRTICTIEMQTVELSKDIINLLFGIYPHNNGNRISLANIADIDFRLEILYTYPDKTRTATFVFPKVRINRGLNLSLTGDAEVVQSLNIIALEETSSLWDDYKLGYIEMGYN
jgi:hypothetical protein